MKTVHLLLLVVAALYLVAASCPSNCSGHGYCSNNVCVCYSGYAGEDCSYTNTALSNATAHSGDLGYYGWAYFSTYLGYTYNGGSLVYTVNGTRGDCDVYINHDDYPTRSRWLIRDITPNLNVELHINDAAYGNYVAGVYAFGPCDYRITVYYYPPCPKSCSQHGLCIKGECLCDSGYTGNDCSLKAAQIINGNTYYLHSKTFLQEDSWDYYAIYVNSTDSEIVVDMYDAQGDCDIYLRLDKLPTIYSYASANTTDKNHSTVRISNVQNRIVYIGVYGFWGCNYYISSKTTQEKQCKYICSGHGTCLPQGGCYCDYGFTGSRCENYTLSMGLNTTLNASIAAGTKSYLYFNEETSSTITFILEAVSGINSWIYVYALRGNQEPTWSNYDFSRSSYHTGYALFDLPAYGYGQEWTFMIYSYYDADYSATVVQQSTNFTNPVRNNTFTVETIGVAQYEVVVPRGTWRYFEWSLNSSYTFEVFAKEMVNGTGYSAANLTMYLRSEAEPTRELYDYTDGGATKDHYFGIRFTNPPVTRKVYVGLFSNGAIEAGPTYVQIVGWSPTFDVSK